MPMFSPLSLTRALPFLPLAQGDIDYEVDRRGESGLIESLLSDPSTKVMLVKDGLLAVPRGQGELVDYENARIRLATLPGAYLADELKKHPGAVAMYLGSYGGIRREHVVAIDITRLDAVAGPGRGVAGHEDAGTVDGALGGVPDSAGAHADDAFGDAFDDAAGAAAGAPGVLRQAVDRFDWADLRGFAPHASAREAGQATTAVSLSIWHSRQRHCPVCGAPVETALAGWAQRCTSEADGRRMLFPRVEPAVITAVVDAQDRLLLQHNRAWKDARLYSVSAGFVEAGENLEHAVRRETREETGIELGEVRYLGSQPWPYPASLMVAFKAQALTDEVRVDGEETATARWVTRDEYTAELVSGRMVAPGKATIARYMIEEWLGREL